MKLTGELKAKVESAAGMEEKKNLIAEAGMELNDEELAAVAGGAGSNNNRKIVNKQTLVFKSPTNPGSSRYLPKGAEVQTISGSERDGGPDMSKYSPLIKITLPVNGWIPKSAIE